MRGALTINVDLTSDGSGERTWPETDSITLELDHYPESAGEWTELFRAILFWAGFHPELVDEMVPSGE